MTTTQSCREKVTAEVPRCGKSACMGPQAARVHDTHAELDMRVASAWLHGDELAHVHCMHGCMHAHMHAHPARKAGAWRQRRRRLLAHFAARCGPAPTSLSLSAHPTRR